MWLVIQIALGIVLGFVIVAAAAVVWWHWRGQWAFYKFRGMVYGAIELRIHRAVHTAVEAEITGLRHSLDDSGQMLSEGLQQNALAGRLMAVALAVPAVLALAERLIFRRK